MLHSEAERVGRKDVPKTWLHQAQRKPSIVAGVAIDEVSERFRNIVTIDIAAALDFACDIS